VRSEKAYRKRERKQVLWFNESEILERERTGESEKPTKGET